MYGKTIYTRGDNGINKLLDKKIERKVHYEIPEKISREFQIKSKLCSVTLDVVGIILFRHGIARTNFRRAIL